MQLMLVMLMMLQVVGGFVVGASGLESWDSSSGDRFPCPNSPK